MSKLKAVGNYIIIKAERKNSGVIIKLTTGEYDEKINWLKEKMTVLSVGEDVKMVKEGDRVFLGTNKVLRSPELHKILTGEEQKTENQTEEYFIGKEEDIACVISE